MLDRTSEPDFVAADWGSAESSSKRLRWWENAYFKEGIWLRGRAAGLFWCQCEFSINVWFDARTFGRLKCEAPIARLFPMRLLPDSEAGGRQHYFYSCWLIFYTAALLFSEAATAELSIYYEALTLAGPISVSEVFLFCMRKFEEVEGCRQKKRCGMERECGDGRRCAMSCSFLSVLNARLWGLLELTWRRRAFFLGYCLVEVPFFAWSMLLFEYGVKELVRKSAGWDVRRVLSCAGSQCTHKCLVEKVCAFVGSFFCFCRSRFQSRKATDACGIRWSFLRSSFVMTTNYEARLLRLTLLAEGVQSYYVSQKAWWRAHNELRCTRDNDPESCGERISQCLWDLLSTSPIQDVQELIRYRDHCKGNHINYIYSKFSAKSMKASKISSVLQTL